LRSSKYTLLEAIMLPNRTVAPAHETTVLTTADGTVRGLVVGETGQAVSLLTTGGSVTEVPKPQIKSRTKEKASIMTEALADSLDRAQLRNLAAFLTDPPPAGGAPPSR
jgi:putative heme-binding domain-containing protein